MTDLFNKKSKSDELRDFILSRISRSRWLATHEVLEWSLKNHHIRAVRDAQQMAQDGLWRRMTDAEKRYFNLGKEGFWVSNSFAIYERQAA